jgi:hypothetical protein
MLASVRHQRAWSAELPTVAGYYWYRRWGELGTTTLIKCWFEQNPDEDNQWQLRCYDVDEQGEQYWAVTRIGRYFGPLQPPE